MNLVKDIEAPLTTSRWYVPSIFEAALMVNTALTKPGDFNNSKVDEDLNPLINHNNDNLAVMNAALSKVQGADLLPTGSEYAIASATDAYCPFKEICSSMSCGDFFECCYVCNTGEGLTADEAAEMEARWDSWLKDNAGDKYQEYKNYAETINERYEVFLAIRGYDNVTPEQISGDRLGVGLSILVASIYANVGVSDGLRHVNMSPHSGFKGEDNQFDVVRAIIAF